MKKILKTSALLLCAAMLTATLASCDGGDKPANTPSGKSDSVSADNKGADNGSSGDNNADSGSSDSAPATVPGETYDTGMYTVTVPDGWLAVPASDTFDDYEGDTDPTTLNLVKGGKEEWDSLDHAYIRIVLYDKDSLMPSKEWYDDAKDMDPVSASGFDFNVFSCTSGEYPYIIMEGTNAEHDLSVSLLTSNSESSFAFGDADVQTIINSISVK